MPRPFRNDRTTSPPRTPAWTGAGVPPQSVPFTASSSRIVPTPAVALLPRAGLRPRDRSHAESARGPISAPPSTATKTTNRTPTFENLKTARQVVLSRIDDSSGVRLHQLSHSKPVTDDRELPLSPTTAHARQVRLAAVTAERDAAHVIAVKRAYANTNVHKIQRVTTLPFHRTLA